MVTPRNVGPVKGTLVIQPRLLSCRVLERLSRKEKFQHPQGLDTNQMINGKGPVIP